MLMLGVQDTRAGHVVRAFVVALIATAVVGAQSGARQAVSDAAGRLAAPASALRHAFSARHDAPPFDVEKVVADAAHAVRPAPDHTGALTVPGASYPTAFDAQGVAVDGLRIDLRAAARAGSAATALHPGRWSAAGNTASRSVTNAITERVTARTDSIEWDLVLAHRPAGRGDLVVSAQLAGVAPGTTPFRTAHAWRVAVASGRTVSIDEMVVTDAHGTERFRVLPTIADGRLRVVVPASVLDDSAYPLVLDPTVTPEYLASPNLPPNDRGTPAVAYNGSEYLVAWSDFRTTNTYGLYATRVTPDGAVLDPGGISVSDGTDSVFSPRVASDGQNFLVVWGGNSKINGRRVSAAGALLDAGNLNLSPGSSSAEHPDVAWDGTSYVVVWSDFIGINGPDIYDSRVTPQGQIVDTGAITAAAGAQENPRIAAGADSSLIVWEDTRLGTRNIFGARFGPGGLMDPSGIVIATPAGSQLEPAVGYNGTNFLVAWGDTRNNFFDVRGTRVSPAGHPLDASNNIAIATAAGTQRYPEIAHLGSNFYVAYDNDAGNNTADALVTRVSNAGAVLSPNPITVHAGGPTGGNGGTVLPTIASDGTNVLVPFRNTAAGATNQVYAGRVDSTGAALDAKGIFLSSVVSSLDTAPDVAFDGTNYMLTWQSGVSGGGTNVYAARVTPTGRLLDPVAIAVSTAAGDQTSPKIAFDGTNYLVVWTDQRAFYDIYGARITKAGTVLEPNGIPISTESHIQAAPNVAWNGSHYMVVWQDQRNGLDDAYVARLTSAGTVLDPNGIRVSASPGSAERYTRIATDGSNFFLVWGDERTSVQFPDIYGARVTDGGAVLDPTGIPISLATNYQNAPSVAFDGTNYLVAWADLRNGNSDVYGARVSKSGTVLDPNGIPISTGPNDQSLPDVTYTSGFVVVFTDRRNSPNADQIYGARVAADGTVQDPSGIAISTVAGDHNAPMVASGGGGKFGTVYDRSTGGVWLRVSPAPAPK